VLDLKITGGRLIDGTGVLARRGDVGVTGDAITAVGDLSAEPAGRTIDATGRTVAPGFIDMHSHSDWRLWDNRRAESKIRQGVTTEVVGNCGFSPAPVSDAFRDEMKGFALYLPAGMDFSWRTVADYLARYEKDGVAVNVVQLIGHGTLRLAAMGFARRPPTAPEQAAMERMMDEAMADGAPTASPPASSTRPAPTRPPRRLSASPGAPAAAAASTRATSAARARRCSTRWPRPSGWDAKAGCPCR
jgi:N-acyl-D-aspartate/D-glutamate deacylase